MINTDDCLSTEDAGHTRTRHKHAVYERVIFTLTHRRSQGVPWVDMHPGRRKKWGGLFIGVSCKCTLPGGAKRQICEEMFAWRRLIYAFGHVY